MSGILTRFLHTSDFHLGSPLFGVSGLPSDLRHLMVDARYRAVERVFDVALEEQVDFLVVSGGVLGESATDPRCMWFLAEQCERLTSRAIPVYWIEEQGGLESWADYVPLPANVYHADTQVGHSFLIHSSSGAPIRILAGSDFRAESSPAAATVCALPDGLEGQLLSSEGVDYWALGGRAAPGAVPAVCGLAQFAGSPQGRSLSEPGPHGCQVVTVDDESCVTSRFVPTDVVRWHEERVCIDERRDWNGVCEELRTRKVHIARSSEADAVLVRWMLEGHGIVWQQLLRDDVCERVLAALRDRPGASPSRVWSIVVEPVPDPEERRGWDHLERPFSSSKEESAAQEGGHRLAGPHFADDVRRRAMRETARALAERPH